VLVQRGILEQFNQRLTEVATQLKVTKGRKLCTDDTVVETNIHPAIAAGWARVYGCSDGA
jgi:ABC-type tungstate transport system substrate-binding protein